MGKRSKVKGARGELEAVAILQPWWRRLEPEAVFARTPGSGGWSTSKTFSLKCRGDIMVDPETCKRFPFSVEVKFQKVITLAAIEHFIAGEASPINAFWQQCLDAAEFDNLEPLLLFRGNRMPWRACYLVQRPVPSRRIVLTDHLVAMNPLKFAKEAVPT